MAEGLKRRTASTLKWNTIDRVLSQVLYAVVGIVLANVVSQEDFGLVGALLVFQAFGTLFVDSGFGAALLQKKNPDETDYSTIFWFNLVVATAVYWILFFCAPLIADIFQDDRRLIPLSKVMFLSFIFNGLGIVQTNKLMKQMNVKQIAIGNTIGLTVSGGLGIGLALAGYGAWAIVWQTVTLSAVKTGWLWCTGHWWPKAPFRFDVLKKMWRLALSVFSSSALNIFFMYLYNFVIGVFYSLKSLGIYTQADKWSMMGTGSITQVLKATFVPVLSRYQENPDEYRRCMKRINRFCAFVTFPVMTGLALMAAPLFHALFGDKWNDAIILFQLLTLRGICVVLISQLITYMLGLGYGRRLFAVEVVKDVLTVVAILCTVWYKSLLLLVIGLLCASAVTLLISLCMVSRATGYGIGCYAGDNMPFVVLSAMACLAASPILLTGISAWLQLPAMLAAGIAVYIGGMKLAGIPELKEALSLIIIKRKDES